MTEFFLLGPRSTGKSTWQRSYNKGLTTLQEAGVIKNAFGIYAGEKKLKIDNILVLPYQQALSDLTSLLN